MENQKYRVYAKINKQSQIEHIYSTCFEESQEQDIFIKEGQGDEFVHVGYYQVFDERGCHNYKIVNGEMVECTDEEKQKEFEDKIDNCPPKTLEQRLEEAEQKLAESEEEKKLLKAQVEANASSYEFLESCVMEMAGKVYA